MINIQYFLKTKYSDNQVHELVKTIDLYQNIENEYLKHLFANMHHKFNQLFNFMYSKQQSNGHYNAAESRELIHWIKLYKDLAYVLNKTEFSFTLIDEYINMINFCSEFLVESGGSAIPKELPQLQLIEFEPIFFMSQIITKECTNNTVNFQTKLIGEGSYAHVFKYKDDFYEKEFVIKRAKKDLNDKELIRFHREYDVMKKLKSPYVLEVYRYDERKNEYYMEYADETLKKFIEKNNTTITQDRRKKIANQIFRGFNYIHSKKCLHRDISFTNILLQHYDNLSVVKISDFGLVKTELSDLTSFGSEIKGSLNDSNLQFLEFSKYNMEYETFALTRLIYYVMTGKYNLENIKSQSIKDFVLEGVNPDITQRYHNIEEMQKAFEIAF